MSEAPRTREERILQEAMSGGERDSLIGFAKDNLEAIAVAVVMALVIKHFCVEAFKIPTSSMRPTLLGEPDNPRGEGDRILVDKFAYLFSDPQRFDVIVFRYPLNRSRNFIKRIAGLPGEHMRISDDGDLWVGPLGCAEKDLRIPQKRRDVRLQFYRAVYPPPPPDPTDEGAAARVQQSLQQFWRVEEGEPNAWRVESPNEFVYAGGQAASLRGVPSILAHTTPRSWASSSTAGELVRDVRVRVRLRLPALETAADDGQEVDESAPAATDAPPTRFTLRWSPDDEFQAVFTLGSGEDVSEAFVKRGTETVERQALDVRLVAGRTYDLELEYVDGHLRAHVDGDELAILADGRRFADTYTDSGGQRFQMEAEGGALYVENLQIERDLRYENDWDANPAAERTGIDIPDEHFFMLGDNTGNSADSRRWRMVTVHIRGGSTIRHDYSDAPEYLSSDAGDLSLKRVVDASGITRTWSEDDEDPERGSDTDPAPFVHEDLIVGRAFVVFWPCWPDFPGRLGFIH